MILGAGEQGRGGAGEKISLSPPLPLTPSLLQSMSCNLNKNIFQSGFLGVHGLDAVTVEELLETAVRAQLFQRKIFTLQTAVELEFHPHFGFAML